MAVIDLPIVGQSYHLKDWAIDCQRTLNFYPQVVESGNAPQVSVRTLKAVFSNPEFDEV